MGPPRSGAHLVAQRGRFQEGSMSDRASAAPPPRFMDPAERAALERPVLWEQAAAVAGGGGGGAGGGEDKRAGRMGSILGQMWEGVRGRLRMRRDEEKRPAARTREEEVGGQRPTREDVLANYHRLVASGFFSSHAVHSTRRPATSHGGGEGMPAWPLAPVPVVDDDDNGDHHRAAALRGGGGGGEEVPCTPPVLRVCSPVSAASSRGTKRTAAESDEGDVPAKGDDINRDDNDDDNDDDEATLAHRFLPKRLRKAASRDISLPKARTAASRTNMRSAVAAARRSLSASATPSVRSVNCEPAAAASPCSRRIKKPTSIRGLRARAALVETKPLCVVPDANRGIPRVPVIPAKFTFGEDRENGVPWRGLRR